VRDTISCVQVHGELVKTLPNVLRTLEMHEEGASGSGHTSDPVLPKVPPPIVVNPEVSSTEPKPEPSSPTEQKNEAPLTKLKHEAPLVEPKHEASSQ
jgi:hypothetical protein